MQTHSSIVLKSDTISLGSLLVMFGYVYPPCLILQPVETNIIQVFRAHWPYKSLETPCLDGTASVFNRVHWELDPDFVVLSRGPSILHLL